MEKILIGLLLTATTAAVAAPQTMKTIRTVHQHPQVLSGMEIALDGNRLAVLPGVCRIGVMSVRVRQTPPLAVEPASSIAIDDEDYTLTSETPDRWIKGTHLKGCTGANAIPDCLVPGSVVVKLPDGTPLAEGKDYRLDTRWAALSRIENGRIKKDAKVRISYRVGQLRLDSLVISATGSVSLIAGKPDRATPLPPEVGANSLRLANVFMPYNAKALAPEQVYLIADGFREPEESELFIRAGLVSSTRAKLRKGEPITIVAWGDSVTAGGDASSPEKAFPALFAKRLGERFPKSTITLINAGIGGSNTSSRLANLKADVLDHRPDLVLIEFVNDMGLPADTMRGNLLNAMDQIRAPGGEVILISPHFVMPEWMGHTSARGRDSRPNIEVLRAIAEDKAVALADVSRRWEHLEREGIPYLTLLANGINHPDDRGHELFVRELMSFFPEESAR